MNRPYFLNKPSSDTTLLEIDSLRCTRPQPSNRSMHRKTEMNKRREDTQDVNVETQMWEKPRQPTDCKEDTMRDGYNNGESTHDGYNGGNDLSLSLCHTLSLYTVTHTLYNQQCSTTLNCFALSHIYTHVTFRLFTHMAPRGSLEHIHVCIPSKTGREDHHRVLDHPVLLNFPSWGTRFPTNSPFTPAWDVCKR